MITLQGKYNSAKVFTNTADETTVNQITELLNQDFVKNSKVRVMSDCHAGAGCVIGFTADMGDKVIPNLVGVDIGCTDKDTEFLSDRGWIKISEYNGESVAVYDLDKDSTFFEYPDYVVLPETKFYHLKTKYGIDQMLSKEHTVLLEKGKHHRKGRIGERYTITAEELYKYHQSRVLGMRDCFISEIPNLERETFIEMHDSEIRVQVMVMADGHLENKKVCVCKFKKERKIERCRQLLLNADISFTSGKNTDGSTSFRFNPPVMEKRIGFFQNASLLQLEVIADEVRYWDYDTTQDSYCSTHKEDVDFVQYTFACLGYRTSINYDDRIGKESYRCIVSDGKPRVQLAGFPKTNIEIVKSKDGKKYCFTTSTGFWIMRRNGCITITGNCGMFVVKLGRDFFSLSDLDEVIHNYVPAGFNIHNDALVEFEGLRRLKCLPYLRDGGKFDRSIGTLGGGNHFIEIDVDEDGNKYLVIHSGSRNLGKQVAEYYQDLAVEHCTVRGDLSVQKEVLIGEYKAQGRMKEIPVALRELEKNYVSAFPYYPKELCFLEGEQREDYLHDMFICQTYAEENRYMIASIITQRVFGAHVDEYNSFSSIHNYVSEYDNIIRKGAVSAYKGEELIIPINMRDGSILAFGKGNPDWNFSAPHGAGRLMGRAEAKRKLSLSTFEEQMEGIYTTTANSSTLDEAPLAYKPMKEILDNIGETVEVTKIIKPIYNFKSSGD